MNKKDIPRIIYNTFESLYEYVINNGQSISYNHFLEVVSESCDYQYTEKSDLDIIIDKICNSCEQISCKNNVIDLHGLNQLWIKNWPVDKREIEQVLGFKLEEV
jgi:hypothetical protein